MASLRNLVTRVFVYTNFRGVNRLMIADTKKQYSVFKPTMKNPIYKPVEQEVLQEEGQLESLALQEIKPAFSNETSSEFHDVAAAKFINYLMREGKKNAASTLLRKTFGSIKRNQIERYNKAESPEERSEIELDPLKILHRAIDNSQPVLELVKIRKGGTAYQVPHPVSAHRARFLGCNWLIQAAQNKERTVHMWDSLAKELIDAAHNTGAVVKRKHELHKQCEANRAYAHFRWR